MSAEALRAWATGLRPAESAVELVVTALGGRLADGPWVRTDSGRVWFDPDVAVADAGALSGGERRVLAVAASLVSDAHPVDLGDAITGLDPDAARLVLAALAHAAGLNDGLELRHRTEPPISWLDPAPEGSSLPRLPAWPARSADDHHNLHETSSSASAPDATAAACASAPDSAEDEQKGG
ncbi:hypothetical protein CGZ95_08945 [Enemella evansiae]|uniref:hypothetical protein n=1 Tax=Enemella evansiae TaxID=2016499 RepID=UPI000B96E60F|nr:hypothetical protein [Enemella evansiae]OYO00739.1 hypothetical protein CGZ95_08945 [Enemella evansiae]